jgi:hypothetical protein
LRPSILNPFEARFDTRPTRLMTFDAIMAPSSRQMG